MSYRTPDASRTTDAPAGTTQPGGVTTVYKVSGMTCGHCETAVTKELTAVAGVTGVTVDLATGLVTVASATEPDDALIRAAVDEAGYDLDGRAATTA